MQMSGGCGGCAMCRPAPLKRLGRFLSWRGIGRWTGQLGTIRRGGVSLAATIAGGPGAGGRVGRGSDAMSPHVGGGRARSANMSGGVVLEYVNQLFVQPLPQAL